MNATGPEMIPFELNMIRYVCISVWCTIVVFGLLGNVLTIAVLVGPKLNNSSTTFYLTSLAFVDILYLIVSVGSQIYELIFMQYNYKVRNFNFMSCITMSIVLFSLTYISVWLLVSVAIDRMIWVIFPFSAKVICTRNIAKLVVILLVLLFILFDLHFIWTLKLYSLPTNDPLYNRTKCMLKHNMKFKFIFPYIDLALIMGLPFLIMLSANVQIISRLHQMESFRKRMKASNVNNSNNKNISSNTEPLMENTNTNNKKNNNQSKVQTIASKATTTNERHKRSTRRISRDKQTGSLTKMLLSVNIFFLVSTTPLLTYNILFIVFEFTNQISVIVMYGIEKTLYTLWYLNFSVHFLLYCMSGPKFRQEAMRLFCKYCFYFRCCYNNICCCTNGNNNNDNNTKNNNKNNNRFNNATQCVDTQIMKTYVGGTEENKYCKLYPTSPETQSPKYKEAHDVVQTEDSSGNLIIQKETWM